MIILAVITAILFTLFFAATARTDTCEEHTVKRKSGKNFRTGCYAEFDDDGHGSIIITSDEQPIS